ncbi:MAG: V-type ATP synthase subunit E [Planctomycetota bacterium]|jgi:vacuolar-type H+-ATPase subunit E/Vma4
MDSAEKGKAAMIAGIEEDARREEERIIADAENQAAEKRKYGEKKVESLLNDARQKAQEEVAALRRRTVSSAEREIKRRSLRARDTLMQDIMSKVEEKLNAMTGVPEYRSILIAWTTEAAIGLDAEAAHVNASEAERALIDDGPLWEARERVKSQTGKEVTLAISDAPPLESQGVLLTTLDGRIAFNNQVKTRISRKRREIQTLIYDAVFAASQEEPS